MTEQVSTFVFADLAGYTTMTEVHGDDRAADTAADFARFVRGVKDDYGAEEVKAIGDALLLRLPDAGQALHLAARLVGDYGARHQTLGVRVGMHTGVAVCREGDWFGSAVNVAARVADLARAGEVLLTARTRAAVGDAVLPGQLRPRGHQRLKNVSDRVEVLALVPEDADQRSLPVDPVCRMSVEPTLAAARVTHRGTEYYLCSPGCAVAFRSTPDRYTALRSVRGTLLVSDAARDTASRRLARAFAKGRLTDEELEARSELVWSARSRADLQLATVDLPRHRRRPNPFLVPFWPVVWPIRRLRRRLRRRRALRSGR